MFTATALFASVSPSLVLGRPQDRRHQARDFTDDLDFKLNLGANPNGFIIPSPSNFLPPSPSPNESPSSSISSIGFPNLGFNAPETLSALPQTPANTITDPFGSTGFPTDFANTLNLPGDDASDMAMIVSDNKPKPVDLETDAIRRSIDSVNNGQFAYAIFGVSNDLQTLGPTFFSNDQDWNAFAQKVRTVEPSYVLHLIPKGMLLIFTFQADSGLQHKPALFLKDHFRAFHLNVEQRCQKLVYNAQVFDDDSLKSAIDLNSGMQPVTFSE